MNWRRLFGLDPAVLAGGGVTTFQLSGGGEIRVDPERLQRMTISLADIYKGQIGNPIGISLRDPVKMNRLTEELVNHRSPNREEEPLTDKDKNKLHGLHLDDYQPRSHEHGVQRITFERAYPPLPEQDAEAMHFTQRPSTEWVDWRSRSPLHAWGTWPLPPMRDALADLIEHLHHVHAKLAEQGLVAVEVSVRHEPTPSKPDGSGQGWNFAVHTVAVPQAVLDAEQRKFDEALAAGPVERSRY